MDSTSHWNYTAGGKWLNSGGKCALFLHAHAHAHSALHHAPTVSYPQQEVWGCARYLGQVDRIHPYIRHSLFRSGMDVVPSWANRLVDPLFPSTNTCSLDYWYYSDLLLEPFHAEAVLHQEWAWHWAGVKIRTAIIYNYDPSFDQWHSDVCDHASMMATHYAQYTLYSMACAIHVTQFAVHVSAFVARVLAYRARYYCMRTAIYAYAYGNYYSLYAYAYCQYGVRVAIYHGAHVIFRVSYPLRWVMAVLRYAFHCFVVQTHIVWLCSKLALLVLYQTYASFLRVFVCWSIYHAAPTLLFIASVYDWAAHHTKCPHLARVSVSRLAMPILSVYQSFALGDTALLPCALDVVLAPIPAVVGAATPVLKIGVFMWRAVSGRTSEQFLNPI